MEDQFYLSFLMHISSNFKEFGAPHVCIITQRNDKIPYFSSCIMSLKRQQWTKNICRKYYFLILKLVIQSCFCLFCASRQTTGLISSQNTLPPPIRILHLWHSLKESLLYPEPCESPCSVNTHIPPKRSFLSQVTFVNMDSIKILNW